MLSKIARGLQKALNCLDHSERFLQFWLHQFSKIVLLLPRNPSLPIAKVILGTFLHCNFQKVCELRPWPHMLVSIAN